MRVLCGNGLSIKEMAEEFGVCRMTVKNWINRLGLPRPRPRTYGCPNPQRFTDLWTGGVLTREMAEEFGVSRRSISEWAKRLGLQPRQRTKVDLEAFRRDCEAGLTPARLAERYKIAQGYARLLRRRMGFPPLRPRRPPVKVVEVAQLDGVTYEKTERQRRMEEVGRRLTELQEFGRRWTRQNVFSQPLGHREWEWSDWLERARGAEESWGWGSSSDSGPAVHLGWWDCEREALEHMPEDIVGTIKEYLSLEKEYLKLQEERRRNPLRFVRILKVRPLEG